MAQTCWQNFLRTGNWVGIVMLASFGLSAIAAESYIPASPDEVVEILPRSVVELAAQSRGRERRQLDIADSPADTSVLLQQILTAYRLAISENDPRAYGYTLNLVNTWPGEQTAPSVLYLLKADVLQHGHKFTEARTALERVLSVNPENVQALQMLAQISLVMADYDTARQSCRQMLAFGFDMQALNCRTQLEGVTGSAQAALTEAEAAIELSLLSSAQSLELRITAATISHRLARYQQAAEHYDAALALAPNSTYVLINYSDSLLEQGRAADAILLLENSDKLDSEYEIQLNYLRARLATNQIGPDNPILQELNSALSVMRRRGEDRPHKLIAQHALEITQEFSLAHEAALANWQEQKEPSDFLLLARAAVAANETETLAQLRAWRSRTGLQDSRFEALLDSLEVSQ